MQEILQNTEPLNFDKVWLALMETRNLLDSKFQEARQLLDSKFQETDRQMKESDRKFQETMNLLDSKFQETDRQMKKSDKKLNKLEDLFTSQWGRLMESLVRGDLVPILNNRGIPVNVTTQRTELYYNKRKYEFDIIAENGNEIVVVEVKTTLRPRDIKEFLDELKIFKQILPKYKDNIVYGALAYLQEDSNCSTLAEKKGLFTIRAKGKSAWISNQEDFKPKAW